MFPSVYQQKPSRYVQWLMFCVFLSLAAAARAGMVATFTKPLYPGMVLEFQFSNLSSPWAMKGKGECEAAGRMMVLVVAYDPNSPFNGFRYASGCWHVVGSTIVVNSKIVVNSAPFNLNIPVSKTVVKPDFTAWSNYKIDRSRKNPPEKIIPTVEKKKAQLDISPETVAYTSSETMLGKIEAIQLLDKDISSSHCPVEGAVKLAISTESSVADGTVTEEGAEVCWYVDVEDAIHINGYLPRSNNTFHRTVKKTDLTLTNVFKAWPEPCRTTIAAERFRCRY